METDTPQLRKTPTLLDHGPQIVPPLFVPLSSSSMTTLTSSTTTTTTTTTAALSTADLPAVSSPKLSRTTPTRPNSATLALSKRPQAEFSNLYANGIPRGFMTYQLRAAPSPRTTTTSPDKETTATTTTPSDNGTMQDRANDTDPRLTPRNRPINPKRERREKQRQNFQRPVEYPHQNLLIGDIPSPSSIPRKDSPFRKSSLRPTTPSSKLPWGVNGVTPAASKPNLVPLPPPVGETQILPPQELTTASSSPSLTSTSTTETVEDSFSLDTDSQSVDNPTPDIQEEQYPYSDDQYYNLDPSNPIFPVGRLNYYPQLPGDENDAESACETQQIIAGLRTVGRFINSMKNEASQSYSPSAVDSPDVQVEANHHSSTKQQQSQWKYRIYTLEKRIQDVEKQLIATLKANVQQPASECSEPDARDIHSANGPKFDEVIAGIDTRIGQLRRDVENHHTEQLQAVSEQYAQTYNELKTRITELESATNNAQSSCDQIGSQEAESRTMLSTQISELNREIVSLGDDTKRLHTQYEEIHDRFSDATIVLSKEVCSVTSRLDKLEQQLLAQLMDRDTPPSPRTSQSTHDASLRAEMDSLHTNVLSELANFKQSIASDLSQIMRDADANAASLRGDIKEMQSNLDKYDERIQLVEQDKLVLSNELKSLSQTQIPEIREFFGQRYTDIEQHAQKQEASLRSLMEDSIESLLKEIEETHRQADHQQRQTIAQELQQFEDRLEGSIRLMDECHTNHDRTRREDSAKFDLRIHELFDETSAQIAEMQQLRTEFDTFRITHEQLVSRVDDQRRELTGVQEQMNIIQKQQESANAEQPSDQLPEALLSLDQLRTQVDSLQNRVNQIELDSAGPSAGHRIDEIFSRLSALEAVLKHLQEEFSKSADKTLDRSQIDALATQMNALASKLRCLLSVAENVEKQQIRLQSVEKQIEELKKVPECSDEQGVIDSTNALESMLNDLSSANVTPDDNALFRYLGIGGVSFLLICAAVLFLLLPRQKSFLGFPPF